MLNKFCEYLNANLPGYINGVNFPHIDNVIIGVGNIATYDAGQNTHNANLLMTIIRTEEETSLKNFPNQKFLGNNYIDKRYPKIYLNYYILFTATLEYNYAVAAIHRTIRFFQANNTFKLNSDGYDVDLSLELFSPSFEQLNQIWSILGGKQYPHVIYKARLAELEYTIPPEPLHVITTIEGNISEK